MHQQTTMPEIRLSSAEHYRLFAYERTQKFNEEYITLTTGICINDCDSYVFEWNIIKYF